MKIKQVYALLNQASKEAFGTEAMTVKDLTGLISLGNEVFSSENNKDNFLNTLLDRIGKTIITSRVYRSSSDDLMRDGFEWGAILQKISVDMPEAEEAVQWNLVDGNSVDNYVIRKSNAMQKLFSGITTWECDVTVPDIQLKTAFTSETEMATFIDAIFVSMDNSIQTKLDVMSNLCRANFIGLTITNNNVNRVRHLLTEYNELFSKTLTSNVAMYDIEFLKYATKEISLTVDLIATMSTMYNVDEKQRFTDKDFVRVTILSDFAKCQSAYLQSGTYHKDLVELPLYNEIPFWQANGNVVTRSSINLKTSDGVEVAKNYIIALVSDKEAMGTTINNRRTKSSYNDRGEYTTYFNKADIGYFNDTAENGVVFLLD